jgi:integrase
VARTVKDSNLDSRTARSRLEVRGKPYYRTIDPGLHLGYRRLGGGVGKWVVRLYRGEQDYTTETIASADDVSDATFSDLDLVTARIKDTDILTFAQAQSMARRLRDERSKASAGIVGRYTVSRALADYFAFLRSEGRPEYLVADTEKRAKSLIESKIGEVDMAALTTEQLRTWRDNLVRTGARTRTAEGQAQKHREIQDEDALRARRASVNRNWATLRAALNHAFREGKVETDSAWRKVKPFKGVDGQRTEYLSVAEAERLINACDPDFRLIVQAALVTGGRYSSLVNLRVRDFHPDAGTIDLRTRKGDGNLKKFSVILEPDEALPFFQRVCAGRADDELIFVKAGGAWGRSHQTDPMKEACLRAKIQPLGFNQLRHTWASHAVMNGTPLLVVAKNLGHRDTRMVEAHYGHLAESYLKTAVNAGAPRFGVKPDKKITAL